MNIGYIRGDYPIIRCIKDKVDGHNYLRIRDDVDMVSFVLRAARHLHVIKNTDTIDDRATYIFSPNKKLITLTCYILLTWYVGLIQCGVLRLKAQCQDCMIQ